jgi:cytochrome c oxidase accessory protein FixG
VGKHLKETKLTTKNRFELDPERLATTDQEGHRVYLYPEDVEGVWKNRRTIFFWFLILLYLVLPWIYINGKPALMLNIFTREFTFMGFSLHGVEPVLIFLVVISSLFLIAFMTSLFGRVWCGWACPQTVFIQQIFSKIETLVEGNARTRRVLDESPWTAGKIFKRSLKWFLFTIISLHIAHTFFGYFVGPRELLQMSLHSPSENLGIFIAVMIFTAILLFDFGWFREQFCIIACPYGRMQSVLMDENSLVVAYDNKRGEPRRNTVPRDQEGDCINCYACVKVCPTGIDIRRGTQLECIACTNCIDACDEIMDKMKRPHGLIRYSSESELSGKIRKTFTPRSIAYFAIFLGFLCAIVWFLSNSTNLSFVFIRGANPFQIIKESNGVEKIMNNFTLKITHQGTTQYDAQFVVNDPALKNKIEIVTMMKTLKIDRPEMKTVIIFKFDRDILQNGTRKFKMDVVDHDRLITTQEVVLVGPAN